VHGVCRAAGIMIDCVTDYGLNMYTATSVGSQEVLERITPHFMSISSTQQVCDKVAADTPDAVVRCTAGVEAAWKLHAAEMSPRLHLLAGEAAPHAHDIAHSLLHAAVMHVRGGSFSCKEVEARRCHPDALDAGTGQHEST
jgi:hypothetical protein